MATSSNYASFQHAVTEINETIWHLEKISSQHTLKLHSVLFLTVHAVTLAQSQPLPTNQSNVHI